MIEYAKREENMDWIQAFTILGVVAAMFYHLSNKIDSFRQDMAKEMKDFHGRLCSLEEKYHQIEK